MTVRRMLYSAILSLVTCVFLIGISSAPSLSNPVAEWLNGESAASSSQMPQPIADLSAIEPYLMANLREADSALMAQGASAGSFTRYVAVLTKNDVVPSTPATSAFGAAGAVLVGDRLILRGDFSNLSSALRDFATDPVTPPNPNVNSGIHIHQGEPNANGPFQYALEVSPTDETSGRFAGDYTLTNEQLEQLSSGKLYVDIHTKKNRGGELRGILQPY